MAWYGRRIGTAEPVEHLGSSAVRRVQLLDEQAWKLFFQGVVESHGFVDDQPRPLKPDTGLKVNSGVRTQRRGEVRQVCGRVGLDQSSAYTDAFFEGSQRIVLPSHAKQHLAVISQGACETRTVSGRIARSKPSTDPNDLCDRSLGLFEAAQVRLTDAEIG